MRQDVTLVKDLNCLDTLCSRLIAWTEPKIGVLQRIRNANDYYHFQLMDLTFHLLYMADPVQDREQLWVTKDFVVDRSTVFWKLVSSPWVKPGCGLGPAHLAQLCPRWA
ncbi:hypothetical protein SUGI_0194260 [Cryptomeria japonica]|nr:hypothetical protein SUGI_0194260 [Cryptomeria japonica]